MRGLPETLVIDVGQHVPAVVAYNKARFLFFEDQGGVRLRGSVMPDTVSLIIWLMAGVAGGSAVGDILRGISI